MAITLASLGSAVVKPPIVTIFGEAGHGKTTLGCSFPNPVLIPVEDGTQTIRTLQDEGILGDIPIFPQVYSTNELYECAKALATEEHDRKTIIIDSITALHNIVETETIKSSPNNCSSMATAWGGYGKAYDVAAERHREIFNWFKSIRDQLNINIVFIAHADVTTMDLPDTDPYSKYVIRIHKKSLPVYIDNVDVVGFLRLKTFTTGDGERKKAISNGQIELVCNAVASSISKNRYGITQPLLVEKGKNPFDGVIKSIAR